MSIRPVDMQVSVQRSAEVGRTHGETRPEVAQQQFADKLQKETKQMDQQVNTAHKSQEGKIDKDGRGNSDNRKRKRRDDKEKDKDKQDKNAGMFDVSI